MEAEIIAVGSELLTPRRLDTNSLFVTERLNRRGVEVVRKVVVGDDRARLMNETRRSLESAAIVVLTGGLGPTLDDLTREATADALGRELVFREDILKGIEQRFARMGRSMSENNRRQAFVIEGAEALPNPNGTAPGLYIARENGALMLLPGPPRELQPMFSAECEPRLDRLEYPYRYHTVTLRVGGLGESDVDDRVGPIYSAEPRVTTTILAAPGDIQLHLRGRAATLDEAREIAEALARKVADELGEHVYSWSDEPLEAVVGKLLRERGLRLGLAESCTGGLLAERLTALPGASDFFAGGYVSYSAAAKVDWLGVAAETIRRHGPVSEATAREMAERVRDRVGEPAASVGLAITGVAGPAGDTEETPAGTVFLGLAGPWGTEVLRRGFGGDRERVRRLASQAALEMLRRGLTALVA